MSEDDTDHSSESEEMEAMLDRAIVQAVLSVQRTKRKRVTPVPNTLLPPPPLHPTSILSNRSHKSTPKLKQSN